MKCLRCSREFDNPIPEVINHEGNHGIASVEWCAECNKRAMAALLRTASAYYEHGMRPPWQSEGRVDSQGR